MFPGLVIRGERAFEFDDLLLEAFNGRLMLSVSTLQQVGQLLEFAFVVLERLGQLVPVAVVLLQ